MLTRGKSTHAPRHAPPVLTDASDCRLNACRSLHMRALTTNPGLLSPFHVAFPVHDLALARSFYGEILGCAEGRSAEDWVDFNFYGHQIVAHLAPQESGPAARNTVDGHGVPVRHFGIVLPMSDWQALAERLKRSGV